MYNCMEFDANRRIIPILCDSYAICLELFDFGRNYAKNYASIICQGLVDARGGRAGAKSPVVIFS